MTALRDADCGRETPLLPEQEVTWFRRSDLLGLGRRS